MRQCKDCAGPIGKKNQSGRCRPCTARFVSSQPGWKERQAAGVRKKFQDPEYRAAHNERLKKAVANLTPEQIEARREHGRRRAPFLTGGNDPASRAKAGKSRSATMLAWCPEEWRDRYRELVRKGRRAAEAKAAILIMIEGGPEPERYAHQWAQLSWCPARYRDHYDTLRKKTCAAEAKAMILDMMAADARRPAPKPAPKTPLTFEEKLARVAAGSGLVSNIMPRRSAPAFTLGGVASGSL